MEEDLNVALEATSNVDEPLALREGNPWQAFGTSYTSEYSSACLGNIARCYPSNIDGKSRKRADGRE